MHKHKFELIMDGVQFGNPKTVIGFLGKFSNVELTSVDEWNGIFDLIIQEKTASTIEKSIEVAKELANEFVDKLSLIENHDVTSLRYLGHIDADGKIIP